MKGEEEDGIVDRDRVECLLDGGEDRRPRRDEVAFERTLVREQVALRDVVDRPLGRPELGEHLGSERADDVLSRGDGNLAFIGRAAKEDDRGHAALVVQAGCRGR